MIRNVLYAAASGLVLAACATSTGTLPPPEPVEAAITEPVETESSRAVGLAMNTVDELLANGNTQTGIDRLTQLLGDDRLTDDERAEVLARRGELRHSTSGYDLMGAISDFAQVLETYPESAGAGKVRGRLDLANGEATSLNGLLAQPETGRTARFESLFRLGEHDDALDLMLATGLKPDNDHLIAMYQIGYLCAGDDQTGPTYDAVEPDGTPRELRFCDFGK